MGDLRFLSGQRFQWGKSHLKRFEHFLDSGFLSDTEIVISSREAKQSFQVHKLIVAIGSPILYEAITSSPDSHVEIDNIEPRIFHLFLKFLYTGSCEVKVEEALPLLQLAITYNVPDLCEKCKVLLKVDLTDETAVTIYEQATYYDEIKLAEKALRYICRNAWNIVDTEKFLQIHSKNLETLLCDESLLVLNETQLITGLLRWARLECQRQGMKSTLGDVMYIMQDFLSLIQWEFLDLNALQDENLACEIENLYTSYIRSGKHKYPSKIARKYFNNDEASCILSRLPHKFAYCADNKPDEDPEIIKFKTDSSVCLLSIGIPAYSQTCGDYFNVELTISDPSGNSSLRVSEKVAHHTEIYHVKFPRPYKVRKNTWYTIVAAISGVPGYGNTGGRAQSYAKCSKPNGSELPVKFEFRASNSIMEGGQIDEFKFKLAEY